MTATVVQNRSDFDPIIDVNVNQYLETYAEAEVEALENFPAHLRFANVVVIPAFDENGLFLSALKNNLMQQYSVLLVLIINQPESVTACENNKNLWRSAHEGGELLWRNSNLQLVGWPNRQSAVLLVQRFESRWRIPDRQGVGLCRKIGCDLAVRLFKMKNLASHWIHSTDADATLPGDYFEQCPAQTGYSAAIYRFQHHHPEGRLGTAIRLYETHLRYYVRALAWAGSPYSFHTIGSCLAVNIQSYCQVRGFPKRSGGEDFYLLNKLAKVAPVTQLTGSCIRLQTRTSRRVPFGTGPALTKILALQNPELEFTSYNPQIFARLRELLQHFDTLWHHLQSSDLNKPASRNAWLFQLPDETVETLDQLAIEQCLKHLGAQAKNEAQCRRQLRTWFDAFRTLKFIRIMQQNFHNAVPLSMAVAKFESLRHT